MLRFFRVLKGFFEHQASTRTGVFPILFHNCYLFMREK